MTIGEAGHAYESNKIGNACGGADGERNTYVDTVATAGIDVSVSVKLKAIWDACVDEGEYASVQEGLSDGIDIERVAVSNEEIICLAFMIYT